MCLELALVRTWLASPQRWHRSGVPVGLRSGLHVRVADLARSTSSDGEESDESAVGKGDFSLQDFGLDAHIVRSVHLPPAPRFMDSIGHNYKFETAVADLVDNSIDAEARMVLARFIMESRAMTGFVVVDDGRGVAADELISAMTLGGDREYGNNSLGYFGIGLKASSFSQANSLTLASRDASWKGRRDALARGEGAHELRMRCPRHGVCEPAPVTFLAANPANHGHRRALE